MRCGRKILTGRRCPKALDALPGLTLFFLELSFRPPSGQDPRDPGHFGIPCILERQAGIEPATYTLARYRSTPELLPHLTCSAGRGAARPTVVPALAGNDERN